MTVRLCLEWLKLESWTYPNNFIRRKWTKTRLEPSAGKRLLKPEVLPLSVIIPTYNEAENIERLLDGVARAVSNQQKTEIVVVDDNSPDGTAGIVESYSRRAEQSNVLIRLIRRIGKLGLSSAILAGMQSARGEII